VQLRGLGSAVSSASGSGRSPAAKRVIFGLKMLYLAKPSMELGDLGNSVSSPSRSGQSLATKRNLVHFWPENALSGKALNAARGYGERCKLPQHVIFGLKMLYLARSSMQLGGLGEHCKLPQQVRAKPGRQTTLSAFLVGKCLCGKALTS